MLELSGPRLCAVLGLLALASWSSAAPGDPELTATTDPGATDWTLEAARVRFSAFFQDGEGYQSQDGPPGGPGSEALVVWQPNIAVTVRQNDRWQHDVAVSIDVVTAASPDAVDATSTSSRDNEAATVEVTSRVTPSPHDRPYDEWAMRYGVHVEEHLFSGKLGAAYTRSLADDNASLGGSVNAVFDRFKAFDLKGGYDGADNRVSLNGNVSFTQNLSRTTLAALTYGLTLQAGTLHQSWNSAPLEPAVPNPAIPRPATRRAERLPDQRLRHALDGEVAQHVPLTASTLKAGYRYYTDDFGVRAHSAIFKLYQYFGRRFYVQGRYRYHHQTGVDFFTTVVRRDADLGASLTADSDLGPFDAHDVGLKALLYLDALGRRGDGADYIDVSYDRYMRSNGLHVDVGSVGYGRSF